MILIWMSRQIVIVIVQMLFVHKDLRSSEKKKKLLWRCLPPCPWNFVGNIQLCVEYPSAQHLSLMP